MTPRHDIDPQEYKVCDNFGCHGTGWVDCPYCRGNRGKFVEDWDFSSSDSGCPRWRGHPCRDCYGQGRKKCSKCKGRGRIARERRFDADVPAELTSGIRETSEPLLSDLENDFNVAKYKALDQLKALDGNVIPLPPSYVFGYPAVIKEIDNIYFDSADAEKVWELVMQLWQDISALPKNNLAAALLNTNLRIAESAVSSMWHAVREKEELMQQ